MGLTTPPALRFESCDPREDLRFDQAFPLAALVSDAQNGRITALNGLAELDRIHALPRRFAAWVNVVGYAVQSAAFGLILQPTP